MVAVTPTPSGASTESSGWKRPAVMFAQSLSNISHDSNPLEREYPLAAGA